MSKSKVFKRQSCLSSQSILLSNKPTTKPALLYSIQINELPKNIEENDLVFFFYHCGKIFNVRIFKQLNKDYASGLISFYESSAIPKAQKLYNERKAKQEIIDFKNFSASDSKAKEKYSMRKKNREYPQQRQFSNNICKIQQGEEILDIPKKHHQNPLGYTSIVLNNREKINSSQYKDLKSQRFKQSDESTSQRLSKNHKKGDSQQTCSQYSKKGQKPGVIQKPGQHKQSDRQSEGQVERQNERHGERQNERKNDWQRPRSEWRTRQHPSRSRYEQKSQRFYQGRSPRYNGNSHDY